MTDIVVFTQPVNPENLSWDLSAPEVPYVAGGTLDVSTFTQSVHYPNGYIPSGVVLGKMTATGYVGPYSATATDGRQTAVGILRHSVSAIQPTTGQARARIGVAILQAFGVVSLSKMPFPTLASTNTSRTVTDGATTASSTTVTSATANFTSADVGASITGSGIPGGATISSVTNATTVVISAAATATATGVSLTIVKAQGGFADTAAQNTLSKLLFVG